MKKKYYLTPITRIVDLPVCCPVICVSINGIEGTAKMTTGISDDETDVYLSRGGTLWDDDE